MNEDFFSTFREAPRPAFSESLYRSLMQETKTQPAARRRSTLKQVSWVFLALAFAFALTLAVSPAARAAVDEIITKIMVKGTTVFVNSDEPDYSTIPEEFETYAVIWRATSPEEISADYPFFAKLPTWVPSGYVLQERAALYYWDMYAPPRSSLFQWKNDAGEMMELEVRQGSCPNGPFYESGAPRSDCLATTFFSVGLEGEPQVIKIHDQPGILIRVAYGFADLTGSDREWNPYRGKASKDPTNGTSMIWENDGRTFSLVAGGSSISKEDLIRMGESIPWLYITPTP